MGRSISQGFVDSIKRKATRLDAEQSEGARRVSKRYPYTLHLRGIALDSKVELTTRISSKHPAAHYGKQTGITWTLQGGRDRSEREATAVMTDPGEWNLRLRLATAHRTVSFMDATGLRASRDERGVFGSCANRGGFDHMCVWKDEANRYIVTAEPDMRRGHADELRGTCNRHEWQYELLPRGYGLWKPCDASCSPECDSHTRMFVIAPKSRGGDLQATVRAILSMPRVMPELVARTAPYQSV